MTTEPTEEETRRLLARAAATIDVDESAPLTLTGLPEPARRRWPIVLAAAAAVVVAIGAGSLAARELGDAPVDPDAPPVAPLEGEVVLDDDQVPGVIGYTRAEATELLEERGYDVRVRRLPDGCNTPGIVTGSTPPVGTRVEPGHAVTIRVVTRQPAIDCVGEVLWGAVWELVRHARGLTPRPETLSEAEPTRDAVATVARLVTQAWPGQAAPRLRVAWEAPAGCLGRGAASWDLWLWVEIPVDGIFCPSPLVGLRLDGGGGVAEAAVDDAADQPEDLTEEELAASLERTAAARRFVTWARGDGPAPDFADRVRLLSAGFHPGWVDEPEDRSHYSGCSGLGFPDCGLDPVAAVLRAEGRVVAYAGRPDCGSGGAYPSRYVEADEVHLVADAGPGECPALVQLWITAGGEIYRVAQVGGAPG